MARGELRGLPVVPGVELGIRWEGNGHMHILGYYVPHQDGGLREQLLWLRDRRRERAQRIVEKLNAVGVPVSFERVQALAAGQSVGRPHVARALIEAGVVGSMGEAFGRFLSPGRPGYEDKDELGPEEAIQLLKSVGALAVLAHPGTLKLKGESLARCVDELKGYGLAGLEAVWSGHSPEQIAAYKTLARQKDLLITGGSDFHGENKPDIKLGTGRRNNVQVPDSVLEALRQRRQPPAASHT